MRYCESLNLTSPFLDIPRSKYIAENDLAFAVRDIQPAVPGHALIISKRPALNFFQLTSEERLAVFELLDVVTRDLVDRYGAEGVNAGFNTGEAAGQTVMHFHLHVLPRYLGDVSNPEKSGIRNSVYERK